MRKNLIYVAYSFEHGDKSLPHLKEMVSNVEDTIVAKVGGRPDEDVWRYEEIKRIIEFIERYIPRTMGAEQMNWYTEKTH